MDHEAREIRRKYIKLVWPIIVQNLLLTLMFNVDTIMIGRLDEVALAAMGLIGPVRWTITAMLLGLSIGAVATVAPAIGAKDYEKASRFAATTYALSFVFGLMITVVICLVSHRIPAIFVDDQAVIREAGGYVRITFLFFIFTYFSMIGTSILRAAGDTKTPMIVTGISNLLNIAGNYILIFGKLGFPALGLFGAGLSTGICKTFEGAFMTWFIFSNRSVIPLKLSSFRKITKEYMRKLLKVSIPAATEPLFVQSGFLMFTKIVAMLGTFAIAANRIALAVESLAFIQGHALSHACATMVGHKIGEKSPRGVELSVRQALKVSLTAMTFFGLLFLTVPHYLARIFTDDPRLVATAAICLMVGSMEQPFLGIGQIIRGTFHGSGDTKTPIFIGAIGAWGPRCVLSYLLGVHFGWGLIGIWVATSIDWMTRTILYLSFYKRRQKTFYATLPDTAET